MGRRSPIRLRRLRRRTNCTEVGGRRLEAVDGMAFRVGHDDVDDGERHAGAYGVLRRVRTLREEGWEDRESQEARACSRQRYRISGLGATIEAGHAGSINV